MWHQGKDNTDREMSRKNIEEVTDLSDEKPKEYFWKNNELEWATKRRSACDKGNTFGKWGRLYNCRGVHMNKN